MENTTHNAADQPFDPARRREELARREPAMPEDPMVPQGEVKDYRQPLVTSLGIVLGFLLSYIGTWAAASAAADVSLFEDWADAVLFSAITIAVATLLWVLYRMLSPLLPEKNPLEYYRATLRLYVFALALAFGALLLSWVL